MLSREGLLLDERNGMCLLGLTARRTWETNPVGKRAHPTAAVPALNSCMPAGARQPTCSTLTPTQPV